MAQPYDILIAVCGFGMLTHFVDSTHYDPLAKLATPTYLLIVIIAVGSLSAPVLNQLRRLLLVCLGPAADVPPALSSPVDEWWERLDPVIVMRATTLAPFIGSIRIASPWAEIADCCLRGRGSGA